MKITTQKNFDKMVKYNLYDEVVSFSPKRNVNFVVDILELKNCKEFCVEGFGNTSIKVLILPKAIQVYCANCCLEQLHTGATIVQCPDNPRLSVLKCKDVRSLTCRNCNLEDLNVPICEYISCENNPLLNYLYAPNADTIVTSHKYMYSLIAPKCARIVFDDFEKYGCMHEDRLYVLDLPNFDRFFSVERKRIILRSKKERLQIKYFYNWKMTLY